MLFAGQNIERSPFEVNVGMALGDANKVSARGPGLEPVGNVANKPTYFDIYTAGEDRPGGVRRAAPTVGVEGALGQGPSQGVHGLRAGCPQAALRVQRGTDGLCPRQGPALAM